MVGSVRRPVSRRRAAKALKNRRHCETAAAARLAGFVGDGVRGRRRGARRRRSPVPSGQLDVGDPQSVVGRSCRAMIVSSSTHVGARMPSAALRAFPVTRSIRRCRSRGSAWSLSVGGPLGVGRAVAWRPFGLSEVDARIRAAIERRDRSGTVESPWGVTTGSLTPKFTSSVPPRGGPHNIGHSVAAVLQGDRPHDDPRGQVALVELAAQTPPLQKMLAASSIHTHAIAGLSKVDVVAT